MARVDLRRMGQEVRRERERQKLSQAELGARMNPPRHQVVVSGIEAGENQMKAQLLEQVAAGLGVPLGTLLLRAGWIDLSLPLEELLASDPELSDDSRELMRKLYRRARAFDAEEGVIPRRAPGPGPGDVGA